MEISTIAGIVVAVIIIVFGIVLLFRKPKEYVPSLESELHINPETNQPVIPRFVRDQLIQVQQEPESVVEQAKPHVEDVDQDKDKAEMLSTAEPLAKDVAIPVATEAQPASAEQPAAEQVETVSAADTAEASQEDVAKDAEATASVKPAPELRLNPEIETAEIAAFEDESSILDIHLHEQQRYDDESALSNAEYIIALNVFPNPRKVLSGDKALKVLLKYGLRFGELSCFHRYEKTEEPSPLMFSVLRMTDEGPSGFDLETLSAEQVQGLSFFLALPTPHAQTGFDMMVSIAGLIARDIDGKVFDENNCELTQQLKEHWRHQVIDYKSQAASA
ncbi:cell division protein ZipA C-terminal FtsZ-binding domain-containing protein [Acinetobacter sp.]|uniref:cell division protein ZipA C-terminal FtsZ-binding domain-containing protein n=1 Tax=Acinetobacter sp. TaxID=472 RepID=UPI0031DB3577